MFTLVCSWRSSTHVLTLKLTGEIIIVDREQFLCYIFFFLLLENSFCTNDNFHSSLPCKSGWMFVRIHFPFCSLWANYDQWIKTLLLGFGETCPQWCSCYQKACIYNIFKLFYNCSWKYLLFEKQHFWRNRTIHTKCLEDHLHRDENITASNTFFCLSNILTLFF